MNLLQFLAVYLFLCVVSTSNFAADSEDISSWLSGASSREWTKVRWEAILDSSGAC